MIQFHVYPGGLKRIVTLALTMALKMMLDLYRFLISTDLKEHFTLTEKTI